MDIRSLTAGEFMTLILVVLSLLSFISILVHITFKIYSADINSNLEELILWRKEVKRADELEALASQKDNDADTSKGGCKFTIGPKVSERTQRIISERIKTGRPVFLPDAILELYEDSVTCEFEAAADIEASVPISAGASEVPVMTPQSEEDCNHTKQFTPYTVVSTEDATITTYLVDEPYYSERIDEHLTIFWKDTEKTIIGYRLKGVTKFRPKPEKRTEPFERDQELENRIDQIFENAKLEAKKRLAVLNEIITNAGK